jgi:hypothetical protein
MILMIPCNYVCNPYIVCQVSFSGSMDAIWSPIHDGHLLYPHCFFILDFVLFYTYKFHSFLENFQVTSSFDLGPR